MPSSNALKFPYTSSHPSPPPAPCPWLWRCHACHIWYRLATTRRCLECDHHFCLSDTTTSSRSTTKKRKRSGGPCRAEFDYIGWAARGAWRRTLLLNEDNTTGSSNWRRTDPSTKRCRRPIPSVSLKQSLSSGHDDDDENEGGILLGHRRWLPQSSLTKAWGDEHWALDHGLEQLTDRFAEKKEALYVRRRHNCWLHCDFPSECHHAVYKAQQEGKPVLAKARALDRAYLAKVKEEERQHQAMTQEGPSGLNKGFENGSERKAGGDDLRRDLLMRFSDDSSDSDTSDSEGFDRDVDVDDMESLSGSTQTGDEILEGQEPVVISPILSDDGEHITIRLSLDMEEDFSYSTFKKAAGIDAPLSYISSIPPKTPQTFEIHVDDGDDAKSVSQVENTATSSNNLPTLQTFEPFWTANKPFTSSVPTSRERSTAPLSPIESPATRANSIATAYVQLEQAYSSQAWFSPTTVTSPSPSNSKELKTKDNTLPTATKTLTHRRRRAATSSSRTEDTAHMIKLLERRRRTSLPLSSGESSTATTSIFEAWDDECDSKSML